MYKQKKLESMARHSEIEELSFLTLWWDFRKEASFWHSFRLLILTRLAGLRQTAELDLHIRKVAKVPLEEPEPPSGADGYDDYGYSYDQDPPNVPMRDERGRCPRDPKFAVQTKALHLNAMASAGVHAKMGIFMTSALEGVVLHHHHHRSQVGEIVAFIT